MCAAAKFSLSLSFLLMHSVLQNDNVDIIKSFCYDDKKGHKANFPVLCMGTLAYLALLNQPEALGARC